MESTKPTRKSNLLVNKNDDDDNDQWSLHFTLKPIHPTYLNNSFLKATDTNIVFGDSRNNVSNPKSSGSRNWTICECSFAAYMFSFYLTNKNLPESDDAILQGYREYLMHVSKGV